MHLVAALLVAVILSVTSCKSTNPQTAKLKGAEETQNDIKSDITELLSKPAQNFLSFIEPIANQFKSIQQLKARADGAIAQADAWAKRELESARARHRENALLWEIAKIFAGPDGLLNYQDVKNTLACMPDAELKGAILFVLNAESQSSSGYTKDALTLLSQHVRENFPLPGFRSTFNPFGFLSAEQRPNEIRNEISRQISKVFSEQCVVPKDQIYKIGTFDLIKTYCTQALEWRSQGILAGVLNLHYEPASMDRPGSCSERVLTQNLFQNFYTKYVKSKSGANSQGSSTEKIASDFVRLQVAKYFGPFNSGRQSIQLYQPEQDFFVNYYTKFPAGAQLTLRGGLPVTTVKTLMDDFAAGRNNLLIGDLGGIRKIFTTRSKCKALSSKFIPAKAPISEQISDTFYNNEQEFRAYFDPDYNGDKYLQENIRDRGKLRGAIEESRANKANAILRKLDTRDATQYYHQSIGRVDFFGSVSSTLTRTRFSTLSDGRIRLDDLYMEQATDGEFSVMVHRRNQQEDLELIDYYGYSVPQSLDNESFMTPCLDFTAGS
jgi:hypothetical protein